MYQEFYVSDAKKYGAKKAVLLYYLRNMQNGNIEVEHLNQDGKTWSFVTGEKIIQEHSYFTRSSVARWLNELEEEGVIESKKPANDAFYHGKFYHVTNNNIS